jgi:arsenate reductase (thioredoxin)
MDRPRVLFLCAHNAARSQMAEALLRRHASDRFEVVSAGLEPTEIHPMTLRVLEEEGIDTQDLRVEGLDGYMAKITVRYAIIVCERTQAMCPRLYPFAQQVLYWPFEDPAVFDGSPAEQLEKFRRGARSDRGAACSLAQRARGRDVTPLAGRSFQIRSSNSVRIHRNRLEATHTDCTVDRESSWSTGRRSSTRPTRRAVSPSVCAGSPPHSRS